MKPVIGVSMSFNSDKQYFLHESYINAVNKSGGIPVGIPYLDYKDLSKFLDNVDGLLLTGGGDPDPSLFGEDPYPGLGRVVPERDSAEINMANLALEQKKPILGVCRGCQILNITLSGTIYQDIYAELDNLLQHQQNATRSHGIHFIEVDKQSKLYEIFGCSRVRVNSFHHQSVKDVGELVRVSARTSDGIVEAIECANYRFAIGVQWHPEHMFDSCEKNRKLFEEFVKACK